MQLNQKDLEYCNKLATASIDQLFNYAYEAILQKNIRNVRRCIYCIKSKKEYYEYSGYQEQVKCYEK